MFKIMIVEDDEKIRKIVADTLTKWKYDVVGIMEFDHILDDFEKFQPDLVLLDINLPTFDGFYWCQQIRAISSVPILFLSSRNQNMDIIMAINMGGDDFIQKPFDLDVLVAKISALLRRNYTYQNGHNLKLSHRDLSLHVTNSTIQFEEQSIELSRNEFIILQLMMRRIGKIVPREDLMQALWNDEQFVDDNTLTVNVNRLRRKITGIGLEDFIVTRKGMGYLIE
ncbi:response regulator transcription factor [Peribacillus frigoritolerans]|jgi:DNA-binding response OmpR family regulator|uniref:response regulator transcription factor n=1 Tax=Peribacillus frigoritolerans TaxID=450367 RepID=UPI00207A370C|nr:response regulator transcription factor [Peribacillus frigoritolerans]MCY9140869.1 response regulator transcription factor [Peribacillus frigoritolerans]MDF1998882.1 response regulator transcription factor [Peribacillus frigoritolerans]MDM5310643.1 response regulator transcription factor [Peribacillus frigoritolerans]USK81311.1 response regulator transcription factor [Peribacillus frigoritolerans]UZD47872.1 response regulator transcription factor [Peribacillus frigoritolerans]